MPEKLLDAARATCVSECISTDAQFPLATRRLARSLVARCSSSAGVRQVSKPGQTDLAWKKRSDFGQFRSDFSVSRVSKPARAPITNLLSTFPAPADLEVRDWFPRPATNW